MIHTHLPVSSQANDAVQQILHFARLLNEHRACFLVLLLPLLIALEIPRVSAQESPSFPPAHAVNESVELMHVRPTKDGSIKTIASPLSDGNNSNVELLPLVPAEREAVPKQQSSKKADQVESRSVSGDEVKESGQLNPLIVMLMCFVVGALIGHGPSPKSK